MNQNPELDHEFREENKQNDQGNSPTAGFLYIEESNTRYGANAFKPVEPQQMAALQQTGNNKTWAIIKSGAIGVVTLAAVLGVLYLLSVLGVLPDL